MGQNIAELFDDIIYYSGVNTDIFFRNVIIVELLHRNFATIDPTTIDPIHLCFSDTLGNLGNTEFLTQKIIVSNERL